VPLFEGFEGVTFNNPYSYSQYAVTWYELVAEAKYAQVHVNRPNDFLEYEYINTEDGLELLTEDGEILVADGDQTYIRFEEWMLGMIWYKWPNFVISGPTLFDWGQVVLVNPISQKTVSARKVVTWTNEVYNPNYKAISVLNSKSLTIIPAGAPAPSGAPI
jgi:hypothetical protein